MQLELHFTNIIDLFSFTTAFMLGLLFLSIKSNNRKANIFLALLLWSLSLEVLNVLIENIESSFPMILTSLFTLPLLLFYILKTINKNIHPSIYLILLPGIALNFIYDNLLIWHLAEYIFNLAILAYSLVLLKKHSVEVNNFYSDLENKSLQWIRIILYVFLAFHAIWILEDLISISNDTLPLIFSVSSTILTFLLIFWIGYNGFSQPEIFKQKLFEFSPLSKIANKETSTEKVSRDEYKKLCASIEEKKLYTHPKLNIKMLSDELGMNEKSLSHLINQGANCNFYSFINAYRVQEFKKLLSTPLAQQLSLLGLAQEAGFNSKSTFYSVFKSFEGITPKQYEQRLNES